MFLPPPTRKRGEIKATKCTMSEVILGLEKPIAFSAPLARALGGIEEAIFVQQLYYWMQRAGRSDGFVYKSKKEWEQETTLTRRKLDRVRKKLENQGIIETKVLKANKAPTLHYKLNIGIVQNVLNESYKVYESNSTDCTKPLTENTTENTTENLGKQEFSDDKKPSDENHPRDIPEVIKKMEEVDPKNKTYYGNKTQRKACDFLIKEYGFDKTLQVIEFYKKAKEHGVAYLPTITTPKQLMDKWQSLELLVQRKQTETAEMSNQFV